MLSVLLLCQQTAAVKLDDWAYPFRRDTTTTTPSLLRRRLQGNNYQSPPDSEGPSYVSSISYNRQSKALHIVGSTYGAAWDSTWTGGTLGCFHAVLSMANDSPTPTHRTVLGKPGAAHACHNVLVDEYKSRVYVVGHNTPGGLLEPYEDSSGYGDTDLFGNFLDLHYDTIAQPGEDPKLAGGWVFEDDKIEYTVGVAKVAGEDTVYTVTMGLIQIGSEQSDAPDEDPTQAGYFQYRGNYAMKIAAHVLNDVSDPKTLTKTLTPSWKDSVTAQGAPLLDIAGIVKINNNIFVGGTTAGYGRGFGRRNVTEDSDEDGFVTKVSASTGYILNPDSSVMNTASDPYTWRAFSSRLANEKVHGLCVSEATPDYVYAVGSTQGFVGNTGTQEIKNKAFLAKIRIEDMTMVWAQHILSESSATVVDGISCVVSTDGLAVYFAGNVKNGVVVDSGITESRGGWDIFVAKIDNSVDAPTSDQVIFVKQFGSEGDDTLARRGGLEVIDGDKVVVVGNTMGGFNRNKGATETGSTVFAVVMSAVGLITQPFGTGAAAGGGTGNPILPTPSLPTPPLPGDVTPATPQPPPVASPTAAPTPRDVFPDVPPPPPPNSPKQSELEESDGGGGKWKALMALLFIGITLTTLAICVQQYWYHKREATTDRGKVLNYLQNFDVEDIDLKHSATGGWHCSYVNDLARGINAQPMSSPSYMDRGFMADSNYDTSFDPLNSATSSPNTPESKVLEDSLFVIDDGEEMLTFGNDRAERGGLGRQYSSKWNLGKSSKTRRKSNEWGREII